MTAWGDEIVSSFRTKRQCNVVDAHSSWLVGDLQSIASSSPGSIGEAGARDGDTSSGSTKKRSHNHGRSVAFSG